VTDKKDPGPRNKAAIEAARERYASRPVRAYIQFEEGPDGKLVAAAPHSDEVGHSAVLLDVFGTTSSSFLSWSMGELEAATRRRGTERGEQASSFNAGLALVQAVGPQDELEAALASQMAASHALAMEMLCRGRSTESPEHMAMYANLAVKLQRTFTAQIEALGRMRGKGQQTVRVEHVTVQPGAQAVVGDVHHYSPGASGGQTKTKEPPHATATAAPIAQTGQALPSPDPQGYGVPVSSHAERPVPNARRPVARRPRQSKRPQAWTVEPRGD